MPKTSPSLKKAIEAGRNRKYDQAVKILLSLLSERDDQPEAYLYLGRAYHALGDHHRALTALRTYVDRVPDSAAGWFFLGRTLFALEDWRAAAIALRKSSKFGGKGPEIKSLLGLAFLKLGATGSAVGALGEAVEEAPGNNSFQIAYFNALLIQGIKTFKEGNFDLAGQMFDFLLGAGLRQTVLILYAASCKRETGNLPESLELYDAAAQANPDDPLIRLKRSELLFLNGRREESRAELQALQSHFPHLGPDTWDRGMGDELLAIQHFRAEEYLKAVHFGAKALKRSGPNPEMSLLMGESYEALGNLDKARNHFQRALDGGKDWPEPRYGLAMIHLREGDWEALDRELTALLRRKPDDPLALKYRALCFEFLGEDPQKTLDALQEQVRISADDPYLLHALGSAYRRAGMADLAPKWFEKALALAPEFREAREDLVDVWGELGNRQAYVEQMSEYCARYPEEENAAVALAGIYAADKKWAALEDLCLSSMPTRSKGNVLTRYLALAYRKRRRYAAAAALYRRLLRERPDDATLLKSLAFCLEKQRKRPAAIDLLSAGAEFVKGDVDIHLVLGVLCHREERYDEAISAYHQAMDLAPNDWRVFHNLASAYRSKGLDDHAARYEKKAAGLKKE